MWQRFGIVGSVLWFCALSMAAPPLTEKSPTIDTYHGVTVLDPYRWLEDWSRAEVQSWSDQQNMIARRVLDHLPQVDRLRQEVTDVYSAETIRFANLKIVNSQVFALRYQPPKQQPVIVVASSESDVAAARIVVDPNELDATGGTSIDWYQVSSDAHWLAVSLSEGGSELGTLRVFDVSTGKMVFESIDRVNSGTAGGSLAWDTKGEGFYYTRHFQVNPDQPDDIRVYQHVYYHRLGTTTENDRYEMGQGLPEIAEIQLRFDDDSGYLLATVQKGDGGDFAHFLRSPAGVWTQFSQFGDGIKQAEFGLEGRLYLVSLKDAPRGKILQTELSSPDPESATTLIPECDDTIVTGGTPFWGEATVLPTNKRLYVVYQLGGPSELRAFDLQGNLLSSIPQLDIGSVHGVDRIGDDDVVFGNASYLDPDAYYYFSAADHTTRKTPWASRMPIALDGAVVVRRFARSKDGTQVPLNIILPKGVAQNGLNPCLVTGYGGYGVNNEPAFSLRTALLVRHGMIVVTTNLRGGGEYGEQWHRQGNLTNKQNVFDDFAACIRYMIDNEYTRPQNLGIMGGSNGGLLMGATLTQHPELMNAVVSYVGIYDMLRVELSPNGAFNVTEFGTVQDEQQFKALMAYSPYHNVINGVAYPATLFLTGANDPRVDPMQSRKMTARLQAASSAEHPVLLRTSANAGHGIGHSLDEQIAQTVDTMAFLFRYTGVAVH